MRKIVTIAIREYKAMVGTKAFLLSIIMMPVLMLGGMFALQMLKNVGSVKERKIAVYDGTGMFAEVLQSAAKARNGTVDAMLEKSEDDEGEDAMDAGPSFNKAEKFFFEVLEGEFGDDQRVELSDRVRDQDLYAFIEIPTETSQPYGAAAKFYSQDAGLSPARGWIAQVLTDAARQQRLAAAEIDLQTVEQAIAPVNVTGLGLVERTDDGNVSDAEEKDTMSAIFLPMIVMMLMFMIIFMASQPMLESVLEEKSQRIAEVLLGSANPFQLMAGKLLGSVGGSVTIFSIYAIGTYFVAQQRGMVDDFPVQLVPWFLVFQVLGVLFYASIFLAVGASVSQLKEAQSLLLPVWMLLMSPLFVWLFIVQDPTGTIATCFSLFPPATPTTMMLRMSTGQTIPLWQPILGAILTALTTLFIVILAGRIFRIGILWQGKTPKLSEIIRWGLSG